MTIEQKFQITGATPAMFGKMGHVLYAIELLRQDAKVPPLNRLTPGQLHRRIADCLRLKGFENRELPSRSTFDCFRRQFGTAFGIR